MPTRVNGVLSWSLINLAAILYVLSDVALSGFGSGVLLWVMIACLVLGVGTAAFRWLFSRT